MGHHKKSMNTSYTWKKMVLCVATHLCFVSHYANAFFFLSERRLFPHPVNLKIA